MHRLHALSHATRTDLDAQRSQLLQARRELEQARRAEQESHMRLATLRRTEDELCATLAALEARKLAFSTSTSECESRIRQAHEHDARLRDEEAQLRQQLLNARFVPASRSEGCQFSAKSAVRLRYADDLQSASARLREMRNAALQPSVQEYIAAAREQIRALAGEGSSRRIVIGTLLTSR
jgi:septal ring factor EnvC (AmiA/AmiB activator)